MGNAFAKFWGRMFGKVNNCMQHNPLLSHSFSIGELQNRLQIEKKGKGKEIGIALFKFAFSASAAYVAILPYLCNSMLCICLIFVCE